MAKNGLRYVIAAFSCGVLVDPTVTLAQNPPKVAAPTVELEQGVAEVAVPLSDPGRPAVLSVNAFAKDVEVRGTNRKDILVRYQQPRSASRGRQARIPPGMRRIDPPAEFRVEERNNEVTVDMPGCRTGDTSQWMPQPQPAPTPLTRPAPPAPPAPPASPAPPAPPSQGFAPLQSLSMQWGYSAVCLGESPDVDLEIEVPLRTGVRISTMSGDVSVRDVEGRIEINSVAGGVSLTNVAGSVVATTVSGDVTAVLIRADAGAPMAFTTLNGEVDVTLPADIKANLKLRTLNGDVFTDFDPLPVTSQPASASRDTNGRVRLNLERTILSTLNGGGADIELRSFSGRILLRKGKGPAPGGQGQGAGLKPGGNAPRRVERTP